MSFIKENVGKITGLCTGIVSALIGFWEVIVSRNYANSCAAFYDIDKRYFMDMGIFQDGLIYFFVAIILFLCPFLLSWSTRNEKSKICIILCFLGTAGIIFEETFIFIIAILNEISKMINYEFPLWAIIGIVIFLLIVDLIITYFFILRDHFIKKKMYGKIEKIIMGTALFVFLIIFFSGVSISLNNQIEDKKIYEIIEEDQVIVANYDGKFVIMECEIQEDVLIIKKGSYHLGEIVGVKVTQQQFEEVLCE